MQTIYLDYNATTPVAPEVAAAMKPYLEQYYGNPSSVHQFGIETKKAVEQARQHIAALLNCQIDELIFTSGGTESNNYALKGAAMANSHRGKHIITTQIEHPAVIEVCKYLETQGFMVSYLPVDDHGMLSVQDVENAIRPDTILISIMLANNEVGTIQPVAEVGQLARQKGILMHTDASQAVGKIRTDVEELQVDLLTVAGHKLYAPKGIGALFVRRGVQLQKLMHGADHERNLRAGTENVLEIVGLGEAARLALSNFDKNYAHSREMRDLLEQLLTENLRDIKINGHPTQRLPNTLNISFKNVEANTLLDSLPDVAASAGAACHSDSVEVSPVLEAMLIPQDYAMGAVRFSTGRFLSRADIEHAANLVIDAVGKLQPAQTESAKIMQADSEIRLTQYTHGLGCACKIRPQYLERVLQDMPLPTDANVIIGANNSDDAAVYRLSKDLALVQTVDFFTPVVDNPYDFGAIAAANALSDIYAMGARPIFALNIVGFPDNRLPEQVLKDIMRGAQDKADEAGMSVLGGHTVEDTEPKFGMAVSGLVHPEKYWSNGGAQSGDVLILTKPIGTGIIATAIKRGMADPETAQKAIATMSLLNKTAAEIFANYQINACTDVTGFGLIGHLKEMMEASKKTAVVTAKSVPLLPQVEQLLQLGAIPGGTKNNLEFVSKVVNWKADISEHEKLWLCDAQTSGGLLVALPEKEAQKCLADLQNAGLVQSSVIGRVTKADMAGIFVEK